VFLQKRFHLGLNKISQAQRFGFDVEGVAAGDSCLLAGRLNAIG